MLLGVACGSSFQFGSRSKIAAIVSEMVERAKGARPVNISNTTHPNAQMSARLSADLPFACSGLIYAAVPRMTPGCVIAGAVIVGD